MTITFLIPLVSISLIISTIKLKDHNFILILLITGLPIIYIRYQHVHQYYRTLVSRIDVTNIIALFFGLLSVLGLLMVASFQVHIILYNYTRILYRAYFSSDLYFTNFKVLVFCKK